MSGFKSRLVTFFAILLGLVAAALLVPTSAQARDWLVPSQAPTVQAAVDSAITGDVVVLAPGIYTDCTNLNGNNVPHIAVLKNGVNLRGETGNPANVILDAGWLGRCLEMRSFSDTTHISGITFRRARAVNPFGSGGAVFAFDADVVFADCAFDSCEAQFAGGGVNVLAGSLDLEDCVFTDCGTDNIGAAIRVASSDLALTGTTIFRSRGSAVHYSSEQPVITRCIISDGDAQAITRNNSNDPVPDVSCTDIWGNDENWTGFLAGLLAVNDNFEADPLYCNPLFGNLGLYGTSPCAPAASPGCEGIGALPVTCGQGAATYVIEPDGSGDFPTIQAAINAAADADTIALADGTFTGFGNRDLDTLGKGVIVQGLSGDPDLAVIDCGGSLVEPHRGFHIFRGENQFTVVRNLTIMNADVADDGAALLIENSSPLIDGVVLTANHADRGAAAFVRGGAPALENCRIVANEGRSFAGGFAFLASEAAVNDCLFRNNWGQRASALYMPDSCTITVSRSTFNANNSAGDRACIEIEGNTVLTLNNCLITNGNRKALRCFDMAAVQAVNTNIFGNAEGDWLDCLAGQALSAGNLSVDPYYCDPAGFDFTLRGDSPCAPYNTPNGEPTGAFGVGCHGAESFTDLSAGLPAQSLRSTGVAWVDFNGDNLPDLHFVNPAARNEALLGSGIGVFNDLGDSLVNYSGPSIAAAWADYDDDGDPDVYYGNATGENFLAENASGVFVDADESEVAIVGPTLGASWADYDGDGFVDLLTVQADTCRLFRNRYSVHYFVETTDDLDLPTDGAWSGSSWVDYDGDGRRDLYLLSDGGENALLHNLETGFEATTSAPAQDAGAARSAAWGDYDNDLKPDLLLVNEGGQSHLLRQTVTGSFDRVDVGPLFGSGPGMSGVWGDYDNDGDLDMFLTRNGGRDRLVRNDGGGKFTDLGELVFGEADSTAGAAWGDYDNDGDLDLAVANRSGPNRLFRNNYAGDNHWLKLRTGGYTSDGPVPGTRIEIWLPDASRQRREIGAGGGHLSSDEMVAHFGLGSATQVDSLRILWPTGQVVIMTDVAADQIVAVERPSASAVDDGFEGDGDLPRLISGLKNTAPNPFNPATRIHFDLARSGPVKVCIYDVAGRRVRDLVAKRFEAGSHAVVWRGRDNSDRSVAAGVYVVQLEAVGQRWTRSVVLVK